MIITHYDYHIGVIIRPDVIFPGTNFFDKICEYPPGVE